MLAETRCRAGLKSKKTRVANGFLPELRGIHIFALTFTAIFLLHLPLLRLPYFWDEAGYYIPAAYDLFLHGSLIPKSVPSNAHPPAPAVYLALWWKLSAFKPAVTRTAMLLLAAFALTAIFKLSQMLTNIRVALAVTTCTAIYPVWFAQSSLAHADLPAAAFSLWALYFYFRSLEGEPTARREFVQPDVKERGRAHRYLVLAAVFFCLSALSKETSIIIPMGLAVYDLVEGLRRGAAHRVRAFTR